MGTTSGNWVADLRTLSCRNSTNNITISFEKIEGNLRPKIREMPIEMLKKWVIDPEYVRYIRKTVKEAEDFFTKAYYENKVLESTV